MNPLGIHAPLWDDSTSESFADRVMSETYEAVASTINMTKNALIGRIYRYRLRQPYIPPPPDPTAITDADYRGCRFIAGNSVPIRTGMFCCATTPAGESWCEHHRAIVFKKMGEVL